MANNVQTWQIGDVKITRLVELRATFHAADLLPEATPENLQPEMEWLAPFTAPDGGLLMCVQSYVVESEGKRIVVDTCVGNHKDRPSFPDWNNLDKPFMQDFAAAGFSRETIDMVICTHLHFDHVGWNTTLENGRWTPTFPRAQYFMVEQEWDFWRTYDKMPDFKNGVADSVKPVIDAKLASLVEPTRRLTGELVLESTPGHTPGHASVAISSRGERAVITGDMMHHPIQIAHPTWEDNYDNDSQMAGETRQKFNERYAGQPVTIFGTHFDGPVCGHIQRSGGKFILGK